MDTDKRKIFLSVSSVLGALASIRRRAPLYRYIVMAGLDPAIHEVRQYINP